MIGIQHSHGIAIGLVFLAVVVGCVSEPAKQSESPSAAIPLTPAPTSTTPPPAMVVAADTNSGPQVVSATPSSEFATVPADAEVATDKVDEDIIVGGKKLSIPKITGSVSPRDDKYHDTENNAIVVLQSPTKAMADFPRDRRNEVDWVKTLEQGHIEPRADLKGESQMVTMDMDIVMKNTQYMPWVRFPHFAHTKWLACENCHPKIFIPQEHANPISMNKVLRGEYCGVCHDKVAFSLFICERCHSVPHEGSGPAWWK